VSAEETIETANATPSEARECAAALLAAANAPEVMD
jgi:hypothetical protein